MDIKILIADDDKLLRKLICDILNKEGYTTITAIDGEQALDLFFQKNDIDLVILDIMMPKYSGFEVLEEIRKVSEVPVLMLTALDDEPSEIKGFKKGANDYISKPFSYKVFVLRIKALLKKTIDQKCSTIAYGILEINKNSRKIFVDKIEIMLNNKEYELLDFLITNINIVLPREKILNQVWGYDYEGEMRTIDTHIKTIRSKLGNASKYIKTIKGVGYMFDLKEEKNDEKYTD